MSALSVERLARQSRRSTGALQYLFSNRAIGSFAVANLSNHVVSCGGPEEEAD